MKPEWVAKAHATTSQSCCCEQMLPPAVTCKKKGNKIQPWFVWPESLRISFEANYFRVAEAAENSGTGGSCGLWQLEISETLLWGERGVELGSGGDLKPKTRSQRWRRWGGQLFKKRIPQVAKGSWWTLRGGGVKEEKAELAAPALCQDLDCSLATQRHAALKKCKLNEVNWIYRVKKNVNSDQRG